MKICNWILSIFLFSAILPVFGFEDCIINSDLKLTNIDIADKSMLEVSHLITIMNEKNTLMIHPLKIGKTSFSVLKDGQDKLSFQVEITEDKTIVSEQPGCEVLGLDTPPEIIEINLDEPPVQVLPELRGKS